jgi:carbohydrate diacid regulator
MDCMQTTIQVPEISARLRERVSTLADEPSGLIDRCYTEVLRIGEYADLSQSGREDVRSAIGLFVARWCGSVLEQGWLTPDEVENFGAWVRRRVHQSVSLDSILCALRRAIEQLWLAHLALAAHDDRLRDELLFVVSPYLLKFSEFTNQFIEQVFLDEQFQHSRWRDEVRCKLCDLVFNGGSDEQVFCRIGRSLGFDSTMPRTALAIDYDTSDASELNRENPLRNLIYKFARHIEVPIEHVVYVTRRDRLLIWVPCARGGSLISNQRLLSDSLVAFVTRLNEVRAVGVGLMNNGARGWATSAEEAITALDLACYREGGRKVHLYSEIAIYEGIRSSASALRYLESLLSEITHEKDLLKTLECYFDHNQHRKATAAALEIHPNTLNYRLDRVEALLGVELDAPSAIAPLFVALKMCNVVRFVSVSALEKS